MTVSFNSVELDTIQNASATHSIMQGWGITRGAVITGIRVNDAFATSIPQLMQAAMYIIEATVGPRGSECPDIEVPTYLDSFMPEVLDQENVRVRIIYKGYAPAQFEFSSALTQVESNLDKDGKVIAVGYNYPSNYPTGQGHIPGVSYLQGGMISKPLPQVTYTQKFLLMDGFIVNGVPGTALNGLSWLQTFEGCVNDAPYVVGQIVGAKRTWLMQQVRGSSKDGGVTYDVSITMEYRPQTWDFLIVFINPDDGKPPLDLVNGNSITIPAVATAVLSGASVGSVVINDPGAGYSSANPPAVFFQGGGPADIGSTAKGTAIINGSGQITGISLSTGGSGYTKAPKVYIVPGFYLVQALPVVPFPTFTFDPN